MFRFSLDDLVVCHLGDLGQFELRPEQRRALGEVDVLFVPVGGGPTIGGAVAAAVVRDLAPRLVVPMHHRTDAVDFLTRPTCSLRRSGRAPIASPRARPRSPTTSGRARRRRSCS